MQLTGTIKLIRDEQSFGANNFKKRELVLTVDDGSYPQHIPIEFVKDKCEDLDLFSEGQQVKISINLRGREWVNPQGEAKYFGSIQGWKIETA